MTMSFRNYIIRDTLMIAATNAIINSSYTWWLWREQKPLNLTGDGGIAFDLAGTPVWIAVLATSLGTAAVRQKLSSGRVQAPNFRVSALFSMLPRAILLRAIVMGLLAAVSFAVPMWIFYQLSGFGVISLQIAILVKVVITVVMTAVIVPLVILAATADTQGTGPSAQQALA